MPKKGRKENQQHKKQQAFYADNEEVREVVIDALKFVDKLKVYIPVFLHETDQNHVVKAISLKMRKQLSKPATFAALQIMMRISEFSEECENAFAEERKPDIPSSKSHLDYTLRAIWISMVKETETQVDKNMYWKPADWNPYSDLTHAFDRLVSHIWEKHFFVMDL